MEHRALEEKEGREINPVLPDGGARSTEDIFCTKLESSCGTPKHLEW